MRTSTVAVIAALLALAAAGTAWHAKAVERYRRPELVTGYRSLVMEFPKAQLRWIRKGDSLDVISVFDAQMSGGRKEKVAATLMQNVRVAGVDARRGTIVLLVNPLEAEYSALMTLQGGVTLALRAPGDKAMTAMEIASYRRLIK